MMHIEGHLAGNEAVRPLGIELYLNSGKLASMLWLRLWMCTSGIEKENLKSDMIKILEKDKYSMYTQQKVINILYDMLENKFSSLIHYV